MNECPNERYKTPVGRFKVRVLTEHRLWDRNNPDRTEYYEACEKLRVVTDQVREVLRDAAFNTSFITDVEVEGEG